MIIAGKILIKAGAKNVLIKRGHLKSKKIYDVLINKKTTKYMLIKNIAQKIPMALDVLYLLLLQLIYHVEKP